MHIAIISTRICLAAVCAALAFCSTANRSDSAAINDSPGIIDSQFCRAGPGEVCAAVNRAIDHDPLSGVLVSLVGPSGDVIASSRTDYRGIALLKLPHENVDIKYVIAEPTPNVIVGVRWYPNAHQYYIEACGGFIP